MKIESWPIDRLRPYEKNPRRITDAAIDKVAMSIREYGFRQPIVVDQDGVVIVGHTRLAAAKRLKIAEVPVHVASLTPEQARAYRIADNRTNEESEWEQDLLRTEIDWLQEANVDLDLTGFDDEQLDRLLAGQDLYGETPATSEEDEMPEGDSDAAPDVAEESVSQRGELYALGEHLLMCGDSTNQNDVQRLMEGNLADMIFIDPPYNANYSSRVDKDRRKPWGGILNDDMSSEQFDAFLAYVMTMLKSRIKDGGAVYCCIDWKRYPQIAYHFGAEFMHKGTIVWDKGHFGLGTYYRTQYELILFGISGEKLGTWNSGSNEADVWTMKRESVSSYVHPTQKPTALVMRAITNTSKRGEIVLDLFGGSGSTLIAAAKSGRRALLMELDPRYCDVIRKRWTRFARENRVEPGTGALE